MISFSFVKSYGIIRFFKAMVNYHQADHRPRSPLIQLRTSGIRFFPRAHCRQSAKSVYLELLVHTSPPVTVHLGVWGLFMLWHVLIFRVG